MPKIDENIIKAILAAADHSGSQAKLAATVGITPAALSRYLKGKVATINAATWNLIFPVIKDFLPEHYHRQFLNWKTPEQWKDFAREYPEVHNHFQKVNKNLDIAEISKTDPRYGRSDEWLQTIEHAQKKIEYLDGYAINFIIAACDNKIDWRDLMTRRALERHIRKSESLTADERLKFLDLLDAFNNNTKNN